LGEDIDAGQKVVVQDVFVSWLEAGRNDDVWPQALIESKSPAMISRRGFMASSKNQRCCVFRIDGEQVVGRIDADGCAQL
jgi:hypothetical protein